MSPQNPADDLDMCSLSPLQKYSEELLTGLSCVNQSIKTPIPVLKKGLWCIKDRILELHAQRGVSAKSVTIFSPQSFFIAFYNLSLCPLLIFGTSRKIKMWSLSVNKPLLTTECFSLEENVIKYPYRDHTAFYFYFNK